jgi:hypothetical protein
LNFVLNFVLSSLIQKNPKLIFEREDGNDDSRENERERGEIQRERGREREWMREGE